jgi:protein SCO1/2
MKYTFLLILCFAICFSCKNDKPLPFLGQTQIVNGKKVYHTVNDFFFYNQNGEKVTQEMYKGKIQIADFFFTTCPTICPTVMGNMVSIYDKYEDNDLITLTSFTLDPKRDSIEALRIYAENLEVKSPKWNLLTGKKEELHNLAENYFNIVIEDDEAPGGINHSGKIVLVDKEGRIRSFADGTDVEEVERFIEDIEKLIKEYEAS